MRRRRVGQQAIRQDHWEPHEAVVVRGMNEADQEWIQDLAMMLKGDSAENAELRVLAGTSRLAKLARNIISWTLTDEHGQAIPMPPLTDNHGQIIAQNLEVRKRVIGELMPEDALFIESHIDAISRPRTKEEQELFFENATNGSSESARAHLAPLSITQ